MNKTILSLLFAGLLAAAAFAADPAKPEDLGTQQLAALIEASVNANLMVDKADNWSDTLLDAAKDQSRIPYIIPYFGRKIEITRVGKPNAEGFMPVEFSVQYPQPTATKAKMFQFDKQVAKVAVKADDFGDLQIVVDCSNVLKNVSERKVRDSLSMGAARLDKLVKFLVYREQASLKGYDRIAAGTVFKGFYYKDQNDLAITVGSIAKDGQKYILTAQVDFLYQHKTAGSYTVKGYIDAKADKLVLEKDQPIKLPAGFGMIGFSGSIDPDSLAAKGTSVENVGIDFNVKAEL